MDSEMILSPGWITGSWVGQFKKVGNARKGIANWILGSGKVLDVSKVKLFKELQPVEKSFRKILHGLEILEALVH